MAKKAKKAVKPKETKKDKAPKNEVKAKRKSAPIVTDEAYQPKSRRTKSSVIYDIDSIIDNPNKTKDAKFSNPMLAGTYDGEQSIDNWYMSEKLDGVRCIWDKGHLWSRNGNEFYPPHDFIKDFPQETLDGELFLSRKNFSETVSIVKKKEPHDGWKQVKLLIFDGPYLNGNFSERLVKLKKKFEKNTSPYIKLHEHKICTDKDMLENEMNEIVKLDGEGIILRDPNSEYEFRRSKTMLKVKRFHDAEAKVIAHFKGTGKNEGVMGAVQVENKDGVKFKVGSGFTDKERRKPPKLGTVITYRYFELSKDNVPRFPTFMREYPGV